jgi:hypothetical protein
MNTALAKRSGLLGSAVMLLASVAMGPITPADARITRVVITTTTSAFDGSSFGAVGPYEQLDGTAYGEVDPRDPLNAVIQDLQLAPRNARGMVEYSMGISILRPVDLTKGNRTLLYETVNRGNKNLPFLNTGGDGQATRDFSAFLRGDSADQSVANPLAGGIDHTLIFGSSQSGRWIRTFIHLGFNESESHKRVFDGAIPHKASNRGTFNVRFAQSTRLSGTQHTEAQYPGQESPQTFDVSTDPIAGVTGGQLDRCRKSQTCPKITATVTDTEYWQAFMALNTTDAAGEKDLPIPPEVRLYLFAGTQHGGGDQLRQPPFVQPKPPLACQLPVNSNSFFPAQRALLVALRDWVVSGKEPPASTYPTIARKSLVPLAQIKLPYVPATEFSPAGVAAQRFHLDRGPEFRETDITGVMAEPPRIGAPYPVLLPQVDAEGNPIDGLRNTAVEAPLGTYTGWNVRKAGFSEGDSCDLTGAFIPFFRTKAERVAAGDPRPSLEERYPTHEAYVEKVRAAAKKLVADRFLLSQDADLIVSQAEAAAIP